jgi:hypothetical protein
MATVRISQDLRSSVVDNINSMRAKETQRLRDSLNTDGCTVYVGNTDRRVIAAVFGEHYADTVMSLPRDWFNRRDHFKAYVLYTRSDGRTDELSVKLKSSAHEFIYPQNMKWWSTYLNITDWPEAAAIKQYAEESSRLHTKWAKINDQVLTFLMTYPTLNQAVKVWEGVRLYIPQSYLDRLDERAVRAKCDDTPEMPKIDIHELTAAAVGARLGA